jgi:hypothetical protein
MQLAGHRCGLPAGAAPGPFQLPGADEAAEEHELAGMLARRTGDVQRCYQPWAAAISIRAPGH